MIVSIYDFDGTVYKGDSSKDYCIYCMIKNPLKIFIALVFITIYVLYLLRIVEKELAKSWLFRCMDDSEKTVEEFWRLKRKKIISTVESMIREDNNKGEKVLIITASPQFLINGFVKEVCPYVNVIGTLTKPQAPWVLKSQNCFGDEKVLRFLKWKDQYLRQHNTLIVSKIVSDSVHDLPLYQLGGTPYHVNTKSCTVYPGIIKNNKEHGELK